MEPRIVYDALTMSVADPAMVGVAFVGAVLSTAFAARSGFRWRRKPIRQSGDPSNELMTRGVAMLMSAAAVSFLIYAGFQTVRWRYEYTHHHYSVLDGCVAQFTETLHRDGLLGVDDFTLQGHAFRLSDSGWRVGYHLSHHHGSPIDQGVHLRALAQGSRLLRIEVIPMQCQR